MANKYSSVTRSLRARNVFEGVMPAPGTDLSIGTSSWSPSIFNRIEGDSYTIPAAGTHKFLNINSNLILRRLGLFCNFADGLVAASVNAGVDAVVRAASYTRGNPASGAATVSCTPASKTVTLDTGAIGDFSAGQTVLMTGGQDLLGALGRTFNQYGIIDSVDGGAGTFDLYDYPKFSFSGDDIFILTGVSEASRYVYYRDMTELNYMYEINQFFTPAEFSTTAVTDILLLGRVQPRLTASWHTDSIASAYEDDTVFFDLIGDFEYTQGASS